MRKFEIWSEGYRATGQSAGAYLHGVSEGKDFKDACVRLAKFDPEFAQSFDPEYMSYWGCALFDNESDARATYG